MTWSLSRLGERATNRASALAFNLSVLCASIILAMIGVGMAQRYRQLKQSRAAQVASWLMMVLALCMAGVALFPNDTMHTAHFVASRGVVAMMILLMVALPLSLGYLTKRERSMSLSFPILVGLLAIEGYLLKSFWFVLIEVILGVCAAVWLFVVCQDIDMRMTEVRATSEQQYTPLVSNGVYDE